MELEIGWRLMVVLLCAIICFAFVIFGHAVQKYKKH